MSKRPDIYLKLAHGYATIDHRRVFDAATGKVPALTAIIAELLDEFPPA